MSTTSVSGYARLHSVSKAAAQKWQARGLLVFKDGKVDVEASDRNLLHAGVGRFADAATKTRRSATDPGNSPEPVAPKRVAGLAAELTKAADTEEDVAPFLIIFANRLAEGHHVNLLQAQTIKENGLALLRLIEARKRAGEVIELADAEAVIFEMFRQARDAWTNFAPRRGPLIAAELGLPPDKVVEVLKAHVHDQLTDLGEPDDPLGEVRSAPANSPKGVDAAAAA